MSSAFKPNILTLKADGAISRGMVVKAGSDKEHVAKATAATQLLVGLCMNDPDAAEAKTEVALPGGGGVAKLGGTVAFGDLLTADSNGKCVATTTAGNRWIAVAMADGVDGDLIGAHVSAGLI
jgi:hypothetical protein